MCGLIYSRAPGSVVTLAKGILKARIDLSGRTETCDFAAYGGSAYPVVLSQTGQLRRFGAFWCPSEDRGLSVASLELCKSTELSEVC
jgi:hypothetical protein